MPLQILPCHVDVPHKLLVRLRDIIERQYTPTKLAEKVGAE